MKLRLLRLQCNSHNRLQPIVAGVMNAAAAGAAPLRRLTLHCQIEFGLIGVA